MKLALLCTPLMIIVAMIGCNSIHQKKDDTTNQSKYAGLVGSCTVNKSNLQINLCLEYSYSTVDSSDPKQSSINKLQPSCEQSSPPGKWQTDGTCSLENTSWICNASAQDGNANAILKMAIGGAGATQDSAKALCDPYKGTLTAAKTSSQSVTSVCSRDRGNGNITYEIYAPSTSTVKRWFIKNGNAIHDNFDTNATYDASVARWTDYFYLNNLSTEDSVVYEVDGKQTVSTIKDLIANRCP